jgi:hypothetical protein
MPSPNETWRTPTWNATADPQGQNVPPPPVPPRPSSTQPPLRATTPQSPPAVPQPSSSSSVRGDFRTSQPPESSTPHTPPPVYANFSSNLYSEPQGGSAESHAPPPPVDVNAALDDAYRAHEARASSLQTLRALSQSFETLKNSFRFPSILDFTISGNTISIPTTNITTGIPEELSAGVTPKLAYTPTNTALHAYEEELNKLLAKLDAVESGGDPAVRDARRVLVRTVEGEAVRLEKWRAEVWRVNGCGGR